MGDEGGRERFIVYHPSDNSAGLSVSFDPNPGPHETKFTVEQLWPDGTAEPVYVGDELRVSGLIERLAEALQVSQEVRYLHTESEP